MATLSRSVLKAVSKTMLTAVQKPRSERTLWPTLLCLAMLILASAGSVSAQLAGVRVALVNGPFGVECFEPLPEEFTAEVVASVFYSTILGYGTAWLGDSSGYGANAPAIDWGDGSTTPPLFPTGIPFDTTSTPPGAPGPVRVYRASFSHVYTSPDFATIRVASNAQVFSAGYAFTGDTATVQTPTYSVFGGTRMILTNTTGFAVAIPACEEIDTVSDIGLMLLALALAAAGMVLIRR